MLKLATIGLICLHNVWAKENPIRRIVTLMQDMEKEIGAEIEKEAVAYKKFECYCKTTGEDLAAKIAETDGLIKRTAAEVESLAGRKKQLGAELKKHKKDRTESKKSLDAATKKRTEEKTAFETENAEAVKTVKSMTKAITALEKGLPKSFLQSENAQTLLSQVSKNLLNGDFLESGAVDLQSAQTLTEFLQGKSKTTGTGEIVGILKMMKETAEGSMGVALQEEQKAAKSFGELKASLESLIKTSSEAIEKKTEVAGNTAVTLVEAKNKQTGAEKQAADDKTTLAELRKDEQDKKKDFQARQKDAGAEQEAINAAIGVLNNDDALDTFNKAPGSSKTVAESESLAQFSLLQTSVRKNSGKVAALLALKQLSENGNTNPAVALLAMTARQQLKSGKPDFSKIMKMIDDMINTLKEEGENDLKSRDECAENFRNSEQTQKDLTREIKGVQACLEEFSESISQQKEILKKNTDDIATANKCMATATEQRKSDHANYLVATDLNTQAVSLINKAKDKLNSFYNPHLVENKEQPTEFLEQAPEVATGPREKSGGGATVVALMDKLMNEVKLDNNTLEHEEKTAQKDYEKLTQDLSAQNVESKKAMTAAAKTKSDAENAKHDAADKLSNREEALRNVQQTIVDLHAQCDFIIQAFDERKEKRENEVEGLKKAKSVLQGAKLD